MNTFATSQAFREFTGTLYRETLWLIPDQLGTTRMIAERTGSPAGIKRHDYLPFGEELLAGLGGRTTQQGYVADSVRQQITSKERDDETGLDYFGARYMSSVQGRFTSVDPVSISKKHYVNPQRWNLYAFVNNNPTSLYDPDGCQDEGKGGGKVIDIFIAIDKKDLKDVIPKIDKARLEKLGAQHGYTVKVHGYKESTLANVTSSLKNSVATFVLGHSGPFVDADPKIGTYIKLQDGLLSSVGILVPDATGTNQRTGPRPDAKGEVVGILGCNYGSMGLVIEPTRDDINYLTLNGGRNGRTTVDGGIKAINAIVAGYIEGDLDSGIDDANDALKANGKKDKRDRGDTVEKRGAITTTINVSSPSETPIP